MREVTGLAVSVGIGPAKMVAKIASDLSKPDGLLEVPPDGVRDFLAPLPVGRLWGVGPVTQAALARLGLVTIGDLAACDPGRLALAVGRSAPALRKLATGQDARIVEADRDAKSYGEENTFGDDVRDDATIRGAIIAHAEAVARRLRHDGVRAGTVVVKIKLAERLGAGRYRLLTRQGPLPHPTDDGRTLSEMALHLWSVNRPVRAVRLIGVTATNITADDPTQLALFPDRARERHASLNAALDHIAARFGPDTVARAEAHADKAALTGAIKRGEGD